jgi:hypothetical protein
MGAGGTGGTGVVAGTLLGRLRGGVGDGPGESRQMTAAARAARSAPVSTHDAGELRGGYRSLLPIVSSSVASLPKA